MPGAYHSKRTPVRDCPQPDPKPRRAAQWQSAPGYTDTRVTCATCAWFRPGDLNPDAGMGRCMHTSHDGGVYPLEKRHCYDHKPS